MADTRWTTYLAGAATGGREQHHRLPGGGGDGDAAGSERPRWLVHQPPCGLTPWPGQQEDALGLLVAQSTEALPEDVSPQHFRYRLNTDFYARALGAKELTALVAAWQQSAISRDTLLHNLRASELLPPARTNEQEVELIGRERGGSPQGEEGSVTVKGEG